MTPALIHCSYHKCLTKFFSNVMRSTFKGVAPDAGGPGRVAGFRHFSSFIDDFYREHANYRLASINNHVLELSRLGAYRISRFIRDPRDLVVSGYFYHKRGAESWCNIVNPSCDSWKVVRGCKPSMMAEGQSFRMLLEALSVEDGLIAEIEFRRKHLESMAGWPDDDPNICLLRYEDCVADLPSAIAKIFTFYGLPDQERAIAVQCAQHFVPTSPNALKQHIRDPRPNQWKQHFTPKVIEFFEERHGELLEIYGYE